MDKINSFLKYISIYVVTVIVSTFVSMKVIGFIVITIDPCGGFGCFLHSIVTICLSAYLGGLLIPTIVCAVVYERCRKKRKRKF